MRRIKNYSNDNNAEPNINKQENKPWWFVGAQGSFLGPTGPWLLADLGAGIVAGWELAGVFLGILWVPDLCSPLPVYPCAYGFA